MLQMDTLTKSCSPTIVITANGEVQTHGQATVYVKELDMFLTMKVLENTPAVLSLGKLCDENGYSYEWINGQKPHLIKNGIRIICNTENFVPVVVPRLSNSSSGSDSSTSCKGNEPCTSYSRTFTIHNYGYGIAYTFTHNNITLEHTAMNDKNTIAHTDAHNTQF